MMKVNPLIDRSIIASGILKDYSLEQIEDSIEILDNIFKALEYVGNDNLTNRIRKLIQQLGSAKLNIINVRDLLTYGEINEQYLPLDYINEIKDETNVSN